MTVSMSVPDDLVSGALTYLRAQPELVAAVDVFNIGGKLTPGIFPYKLWDKMEGSQSTAVVIAHDGGWAAPNLDNTLRFPRLLVNVWTDPVRDANGNNVDPAVQRRAYACFDIFDKYLHRVAGGEQYWGTLRIIDCLRLTEPVFVDVTDGDGLVRLQAYYAITQG